MQLLTILTLIYVAVLVVALAASLIAILVYLRKISSVLGEVREALERVEQETEPFNANFDAIQQTVSGVAAEIEQARVQIENAEKHVGEIAGQFDPAGLAG